LEVIHNIINGNGGNGIYFEQCTNSAIDSNRISGNILSGIRCRFSDPDISQNSIEENENGGIFCDNSNPDIVDNHILRNSSQMGAGICCYINSNANISGNRISGNYSVQYGGGIYCFRSNPTIEGNYINNNQADSSGGGIHCIRSSLTISENAIFENYSTLGAGIYCNKSNVAIGANSIYHNQTGIYYPDEIGFGGGIYCEDSSNVNVNWNRISHNIGNGIYFKDNVSSSIYNNVICHNIAEDGGGILCLNSSPVVNNNKVEYNTAIWNGGGIYINNYNSPNSLGLNEIQNNLSRYGGGGMYIENSDVFLRRNLIYNNVDSVGGGGISCVRSDLRLENNTLAGNMTDTLSYGRGGGLFCRNSELNIINSIFWLNNAFFDPQICVYSGTIEIDYSDVQGGWQGSGNIDVDPLFRDVQNDDFHLMAIDCNDPHDSPCIDSGIPYLEDSTLSCDWGLGSWRSDIGVYGGGAHITKTESDYILPSVFNLSQNYPNPFNASTSIRFILPEPQDVQLTVYDLLGRRVEILLDEYRQAGVHTVTFDASHLSSGVYFYRLQAGDRVETKRMLLLK